ncbi:MAG: hypothetical protein VXY82_07035 [Planctomycetota bacterium]|nr:hypothetical protein [Planctomycetota bacterium]
MARAIQSPQNNSPTVVAETLILLAILAGSNVFGIKSSHMISVSGRLIDDRPALWQEIQLSQDLATLTIR